MSPSFSSVRRLRRKIETSPAREVSFDSAAKGLVFVGIYKPVGKQGMICAGGTPLKATTGHRGRRRRLWRDLLASASGRARLGGGLGAGRGAGGSAAATRAG